MIEMSNKINKDFFNATTKYGDENAVLEIHCVTCHHGIPHPEVEEEEHERETTIKSFPLSVSIKQKTTVMPVVFFDCNF
jgi:hypothetical protein